MATADQVKALVKSHFEHEDEELKKYAEKTGPPKGNILRMNQQNPMLLLTIPSDRLSDLIVSDDIAERIKRILNEYRNRHKLQKYGLTNRRKIR